MDIEKIIEKISTRTAERLAEISIQKAEYERDTARFIMEKAQVELEQAKEIKEKMLAQIEMQLTKGSDITS